MKKWVVSLFCVMLLSCAESQKENLSPGEITEAMLEDISRE